MTSLTLKSYQQTALDTLAVFAQTAQTQSCAPAFAALAGQPYNADAFGTQLPCVCLRIPTGGGKTILAAHAVPLLAREWCHSDAPVAVWLVPSDAIRAQTLKALQTPGHPYRAALSDVYGDKLRICTLEEVAQIAAPDWGRCAVVVVATMQSFRIEDASQRNVYSFSESFEPHFKSLAAQALSSLHSLPDALVTAEDAAQDRTGVLRGFVGQPRWSLANWLALQRPLILVDEAHNSKTDKSFTALQRLNPAFILELTATPLAHKTNVLYHVSAQELAATNMIKLPIVLAEHPEGWPQAVFGAVQTQRKLEAQALQDEANGYGYVRPMVLFQAQNIGDEMPPEALQRYLIEELKLPENHIVLATGTARGLDGIDLAARTCPVRYVITVQALREGWDCPFAYVLCSLQKLSSATAVEQLLGRVLRMPYASPRGREALNRAYAHVCAAEFSSAAHALTDRLIEHMGFEALDVASMLAPAQNCLALFDETSESDSAATRHEPAPISTCFSHLTPTPALLALPGVQAHTVADSAPQLVVAGHISQDTETLMLAQVRGPKKQQQVREQVAQHNALVAAQQAPATWGAVFAPIPTLGYRSHAQAPLWPLEPEAVLEATEWDLLTPEGIQLPRFQPAAEANVFEIGVQEARLTLRSAGAEQMAMDYSASSISAEDLVRWLDQSLHQIPAQPLGGFTQSQRRTYLSALVNHQLHSVGVPLVMLAQARFQLAREIAAHVAQLRNAATRRGFQQLVLAQDSPGAWQVEPDWAHPHVFAPGRYPAPAASRYRGRYCFNKHYFPVLADLKDEGQEFQCAQLIDAHPKVKQWVRNLDRAPYGFGLPTSRGRFFADFVAELADGRIALLEFKGAHLQNDPYEIEKSQVGALWAQRSAGQSVFAWLTQDKNGQNVAQQLNAALCH